jgi:hypothetical protein
LAAAVVVAGRANVSLAQHQLRAVLEAVRAF